MACCCGFHNKSSRSRLHCSCGVCVSVPVGWCCDFRIDNSFCLLRQCQRLSHFRLLCGGCDFGFMLDFSFEFGVALFEFVCFIGSRFSSLRLVVLSPVLIFFLDFLLWCCNHKLCITLLWSLPHVHHVVCFSVSAAIHMFPVHQYVVQLFFCTFRGPVGSWRLKRFVHIVLSAVKFCIINHCLIQSPLLFPSLSVCGPCCLLTVIDARSRM